MAHNYPPDYEPAQLHAMQPNRRQEPSKDSDLTESAFWWTKDDWTTGEGGEDRTDFVPLVPNRASNRRNSFIKVTKQNHRLYIIEYYLCFTLHFVLVAMHIAFLAAGAVGAVDHVIVESEHYHRYSTVLAIVPQAIATLIAAALVYTTQRLATRRAFKQRQTLTALHDQMSAWAGLGSAVISLFNQFDLAAAILGTGTIVSYLTLIAIIHITTPTLIGLEPTQIAVNTTIGSTLGTPNLTSFISWAEPNSDNPDELIKVISPLIAVLGGGGVHSDSLVITGVANGTLYDVVDINNATQPITVNATAFNVSCGYMTDFTVQARAATAADLPTFNISNPQVKWTGLTMGDLAPSSLREMSSTGALLNTSSHQLVRPSPYTVLVSTTNFTDSSGSPGPGVVSLGGTYMYPDATQDWQRVWALQMIGCALDVQHAMVDVDPATRTLVDSGSGAGGNWAAQMQKNSSVWREWVPPGARNGSSEVDQAMLDLWSFVFQAASLTAYDAGVACCTPAGYPSPTASNQTAKLNVVEQYLALNLGLYPVTDGKRDVSPGMYPPPPALTLHELENAMAGVTAAAFYSALHSQPNALDDTIMLPSQSASIGAVMSGVSEMTYMTAASRLHLNIPNIGIGLAASTLLLALAITLVRNPDGPEPLVAGAGILQTIWLSQGNPAFRERVARVEEPTLEQLRGAGMDVVRFGRVGGEGEGWVGR
ncbi:hypothetical protein CONPUDRAFT_135900 [Coniophora puteana RWD-64-598 SS2]|uniref:Uncharacterized protein n=1 Tax=Coniophora puteana (strain RWD-64-598) TaxID=741705 RepID=A0A5M3MZC4_CONPW|nr:uncharacterized protein CONPUDRAFT_135900 [Coniophora puteana RWD-64-598 SS2]EIW84523.1 hypothetical protein CONPUDRAFT_135900 [Coniophora puteana RWD-64-598 SS2]